MDRGASLAPGRTKVLHLDAQDSVAEGEDEAKSRTFLDAARACKAGVTKETDDLGEQLPGAVQDSWEG